MTNDDEARELQEIAVEAAQRTGAVLLQHFGGPASGVGTKSTPTDLVSDADRAAEDLLVRIIARRRPADGIVGEEGAARETSSGIEWVIDPLDGTVNFLFGIPVWGVSIAVCDPAGAVVGAIHDPNRGETFSARRSGGAWLDGAPIRVTGTEDLSQALIGTGFAYDARARAIQARMLQSVLPRVRDIRRAGSAALDLAALACGRLDGFYEAPMERWDKAAGVLIVSEAGGVVSELAAPEGLSPGVIAANPALHRTLSALVLEAR